MGSQAKDEEELRLHRSRRLVTTTPETSVGAALKSVKPRVSPKLFEGLEVLKVSSDGKISPRLLTLSEDLFTIFLSHHRVGGSMESFSDRVHFKGFKAYSKVVKKITGTETQRKHGIRVIDVADILFVQSGFLGSLKLEECRKKEKDLDASKAISIFHNNAKTTDFLVDDDADRAAVIDAISAIREAYAAASENVGREELLLRYAWYDTDWDKSGTIEQPEFLQLLGRINIYLKKEEAARKFNACAAAAARERAGGEGGRGAFVKHRKGIGLDECLDVIRRIKSEQNGGRSASDVVFDDLFGKGEDMVDSETFLTKFLRGRQGETSATIDDVRGIFSRANAMDLSGSRSRVYPDGRGDGEFIDRMRFEAYLTSSENDLHDPARRRLDSSSLLRPLSHYWINSSHNTYLMGDQLKSDSSVEMYCSVMQRGCKCLELDCWDGSWDGSDYPIVFHGFTFTTKIPFQDIITCVKCYVEANPDTLPIILSLENHCSHLFQKQMADILSETLGEMLYIPETLDFESFPSPLDLVGKVVVKGKRPEKEDASNSSAPPETSEKDDGDSAMAPENEATRQVGSNLSVNSSNSKQSKPKKKTKDEEALPPPKIIPELARMRLFNSSTKDEEAPAPPPPKIIPELARLTLFNGTKFKDFATSMNLRLHDMHSFSESKALKLLGNNPAFVKSWKEYNEQHMSRIYPAGTRLISSNFSPLVGWHVGSQLVALNFQTDDYPMTINDGRFRENGGCGYVLKPQSVINKDTTEAGKPASLNIKVLFGSCIPKPYGERVGEVVDPYVIVTLHDVEQRSPHNLADLGASGQVDWDRKEERKTLSVNDNGFCPQWNNAESFLFEVQHSDVAMVEIAVTDRSRSFIDECMCKTAIPVSSLRNGLRSIQFYDHSLQHGSYRFARLVVDVDVKFH